MTLASIMFYEKVQETKPYSLTNKFILYEKGTNIIGLLYTVHLFQGSNPNQSQQTQSQF